MRVLLLGSGGREHALARALAADPEVTDLHAAPGNPGIFRLATGHPADLADLAAVTALATRLAADLVVVGPEAPLVAGLADLLRDQRIACFGPSRAAAMLEGSKSFAKQVMAAAGIPTAAARTCRTEHEVRSALAAFGPPYVVKADGLAAGKGVIVTADHQAALAHARAHGTVVVEEYLDGPEVSLFALADEVLATVIQPALAELARRGTPYRGLLYAGLSLTAAGVRVVEFNARFGDPETQVVLDRLASPLAGLLAAAAAGSLSGAGPLRWSPGAAVTVVLAAEGYPAAPASGDPITGIDDAERLAGAYVLHAGTATTAAGELVSAGGRVLNVVGSGPDLPSARDTAYRAAAAIRMRGGWYRRDIAERAAAGLGGRAAPRAAGSSLAPSPGP